MSFEDTINPGSRDSILGREPSRACDHRYRKIMSLDIDGPAGAYICGNCGDRQVVRDDERWKLVGEVIAD